MNELYDEITKLRQDVDRLKAIIEESSFPVDDTDFGIYTKDSDFDNKSRERLGRSVYRLMRWGPQSAFRNLVNPNILGRRLISSLGFDKSGFLSGLFGSVWTMGVDLLINGVSRLFKKSRSPLLKAQDPISVNYMNPDDSVPYFVNRLETELVRGKTSRMTMREKSNLAESLEHQLRRGVVGL